jgi:hypothetical protein
MMVFQLQLVGWAKGAHCPTSSEEGTLGFMKKQISPTYKLEEVTK